MKVCSLPDQVPFAEPDYASYDHAAEERREAEHTEALRLWLTANGWPGPDTGRELHSPMGDGYARYVFADGPKPMLVHLPYGDAWDARDVRFLPKREVVRRLAPLAVPAAVAA